MNRVSICVGVLLAAGSPAWAQPAAAPPPPGVDQGVVDDASSPGAFVFPTALSEPAGTVAVSASFGTDTGFNESELTSVSASYAATNEFTIGATVLIPSEDFRLGMISAKLQVARQDRFRVALQGDIVFNSDDAAGLVGAAATYCFDDGCNSHISGFGGVGLVHESGSAVPFVLSGSAVIQVVPHFKLVGELITGFASDNVGGVGDGFLAFYGVRLTNKFFGVNVGFAKPLGVDVSTDGPGLLFASFTGRVMN